MIVFPDEHTMRMFFIASLESDGGDGMETGCAEEERCDRFSRIDFNCASSGRA